MKIKIFNARTGKIEEKKPVKKTLDEWRRILTDEQFQVTRLKGTETPY